MLFGPKIGGRLIHGIDLYTGKYGNMHPYFGLHFENKKRKQKTAEVVTKK